MSELNTYSVSTADGKIVKEGEVAFNYYDMYLGTVGPIGYDGWFRFKGLSESCLLNGERICSVDHAKKMGWTK